MKNSKFNKVSTKSGARASQKFTDGILKQGLARRVIFYYPGEEGTYIEDAEITLFSNGIVFLKSAQEETTTHIQNCEIMWNYQVNAEDRKGKVTVLPFRGLQTAEAGASKPSSEK